MKYYSLVFLLFVSVAHCQGTFVYDQQSQISQSGGGGAPLAYEQPMGQSFTPALDSVGFVQFEFGDPFGSAGGSIYVNLWAGSLGTGTLLGSTSSVFIPNSANNLITTFLFSTAVPVSPGTTYYFQPILQSGDTTIGVIVAEVYNYPGGTFYENGSVDPNGNDAWFREGIVVPEPSAGALVSLGMAGIYLLRNGKRLFD